MKLPFCGQTQEIARMFRLVVPFVALARDVEQPLVLEMLHFT
jgi:hypothetical protein